jgi:hypothetical protein
MRLFERIVDRYRQRPLADSADAAERANTSLDHPAFSLAEIVEISKPALARVSRISGAVWRCRRREFQYPLRSDAFQRNGRVLTRCPLQRRLFINVRRYVWLHRFK